MAKQHKGKSRPPQGKTDGKKSVGQRGGNRAGHAMRQAAEPKRSSQAAGQDPHRNERAPSR
jgi:hypothetical protein